MLNELDEKLFYEDIKTVEKAIKDGADVNAVFMTRINFQTHSIDYHTTTLRMACFNDCKDIAKLLIDNGADVNGRDNFGKLAFERDDNETCKYVKQEWKRQRAQKTKESLQKAIVVNEALPERKYKRKM